MASTNVYADITAQVAGRLAGDRVAVTGVISDPSIDPHSYVANTRTELAISHADVIIENGGGYDDFMDTMRRSVNNRAAVINVVALSGKRAPAGGDLNEHVWFDLPTVARLAARVAVLLADKDPVDAATFRSNAAAFARRVVGLERVEASVKAAHAGEGVAVTEPLPLYLTQACGLVNRTPPAFSAAVEEGSDVSPRLLHETLGLFGSGQVSLLAYNEQTSGPVTTRVLAAAKAHHVPVVAVAEILPEHVGYLAWLSGILAAVRSALAGPRG